MKIKFEWMVIGVLLLALLAQGAWLNAKMDEQRKTLERSAEVVNEKVAKELVRVGDKLELISALGGRTVVERTQPGTIVVTTGRDGKDGKAGQPGAPGRDGKNGSVVTTRPGSPTQPPTADGLRPPITTVTAEEARRNARLTHRITFDPGSLRAGCEGKGMPPDTLEIYTFGDGLGTVSPCVSKLEMTARTQEPVKAREQRASRVFAMAGFPASAGMGYTASSFSVPLLGKFNVDALGFQTVGRKSETYFGLGLSKDISYSTLVGVGAAQSLQGSTSVLTYFGIRF